MPRLLMKSDPEKIKQWRIRSALKAQQKKRTRMLDNYANQPSWKNGKNAIKQVSEKRRKELSRYSKDRKEFLAAHPVCPITGERTTDIHHSAHKEGAWLTLKRYWIAVCRRGHTYIEGHKDWARENNLLLKVNALYDSHCQMLVNEGIDLDEPVFYKIWTGRPLLTP